tara:strand:- start:1224 stop:1607 length:384 start_codon:yes stop_codon:yes gene_type:complete
MEKRPTLHRDYCGLLTGQSCYDFCLYVSEEYEMQGDTEKALDWLAEANLYKMELEMGIKSYNKNPTIDEEMAKDHDAWLTVILEGRDQLKQWEMHQKTSLRQKMERDMARKKKRAESGKEAGSQEAA